MTGLYTPPTFTSTFIIVLRNPIFQTTLNFEFWHMRSRSIFLSRGLTFNSKPGAHQSRDVEHFFLRSVVTHATRKLAALITWKSMNPIWNQNLHRGTPLHKASQRKLFYHAMHYQILCCRWSFSMQHTKLNRHV